MLLLRLKNNFFPPIKIVNEQSIKSEGIHSNLEKLLGKIFLECRMGNPHSSFLEQLHKVAVRSRDAAVIRIDDESIVADILFEKDDPLGPHCRGAPPKELNSILYNDIIHIMRGLIQSVSTFELTYRPSNTLLPTGSTNNHNGPVLAERLPDQSGKSSRLGEWEEYLLALTPLNFFWLSLTNALYKEGCFVVKNGATNVLEGTHLRAPQGPPDQSNAATMILLLYLFQLHSLHAHSGGIKILMACYQEVK